MFIIPKPQEMTFFEGFYETKGCLKTSGASYEKIKEDIKFFDIQVEPSESEEEVFFFENNGFKEEEYEILVNAGGITIITGSDKGTFRALSTLKQILGQKDENKISYLRIHDFPDIEDRGIMLCVNSSRIYKMETLYNIVDRLAEVKYNMLQIYFDTFVFEYDSFRKHLDGKMYYTKEEIDSLDAYCKKRHINLVANVETFGHLSQLLACEEYSHLGITRDGAPKFSVNPLLPESFEVVTKFLDDLLPHFSSPLVHIGMDETYGLGGHETEEYCRAFGVDGPFVDFLTKVSRYAKEKYGKRSMFWGDMAVKFPRCMKDIPKDVIFVDWGYEPGHKFERTAIACNDEGLDFYVAPGTHNWGTISGRTDIMINNIFDAAEVGRFYGAKGFLLADWAPSIAPSMQFLAYTIGGAFSWNSGYSETFADSDNEMDCYFRNEVVHNVLKYLDKFIFRCSGNSASDIIYRMGNYWFMEQPTTSATWNGTILCKHFFRTKEIYDYPPLAPKQLKRITNYMAELKEELNDVVIGTPDGDIIKEEIAVSCDMVLFAAEVLLKRGSDKVNPASDIDFDIEGIISRCEALQNEHHRFIQKSGWVNLIKYWADLL